MKICVFQDDRSPPFLSHIDVNNTPVKFEVDTGAAVSLLNESTFQMLQESTADLSLQPSTCKLKTYSILEAIIRDDQRMDRFNAFSSEEYN